MTSDFDFESLKVSIESAARKCFIENAKKYGSDVCSFALVSDDGAMTVVPFTNTLSHLQTLQAESPEDKDYYEFEPNEWLTSDGANTEFNEICKTLLAELDKGHLDFAHFKNTLFESCVQVLEKLRTENFFKQKLGKDLLVLFMISDTLEAEQNLITWAKRLNKHDTGKRFEDYMN